MKQVLTRRQLLLQKEKGTHVFAVQICWRVFQFQLEIIVWTFKVYSLLSSIYL